VYRLEVPGGSKKNPQVFIFDLNEVYAVSVFQAGEKQSQIFRFPIFIKHIQRKFKKYEFLCRSLAAMIW